MRADRRPSSARPARGSRDRRRSPRAACAAAARRRRAAARRSPLRRRPAAIGSGRRGRWTVRDSDADRLGQRQPGGLPRWREAEQHADDQRRRGAEHDHAQIERQRDGAGSSCCGNQRGRHLQNRGADGEPQRAAEQRRATGFRSAAGGPGGRARRRAPIGRPARALRPAARASRRLATLAQQISRTKPTTPTNSSEPWSGARGR